MYNIIDIIDIVLSACLTLTVFFYTIKKDKVDFKRNIPFISIEQRDGSYYFKNIGNGPAVNILLYHYPDFVNKKWHSCYRYFSNFDKENYIKIISQNDQAFLFIYNDIFGKQYYSFMINHNLEFGSVETINNNQNVYEYIKYERPKPIFAPDQSPSV